MAPAELSRFDLGRFYHDAFAPAAEKFERAPVEGDCVRRAFAAAELIEAASLACLGAEARSFPADDVKALLESRRPLFESMVELPDAVRPRVGGHPRAELLIKGQLGKAAGFVSIPAASDSRDRARRRFQSALLSLRALRRNDPIWRFCRSLSWLSEEGWAEARDETAARLDFATDRDALVSFAGPDFSGLRPVDGAIGTVAYLSGLVAWVRDFAGFESDDPDDWDENDLEEPTHLALDVVRAVAQSHAWRLDLTRLPASPRWREAVGLADRACGGIGAKLLEDFFPDDDAAAQAYPWPDGFTRAAERAANGWNWLHSHVPERDKEPQEMVAG